MKPDTVTVSQIFSSKRRYCVPIYQRHYVWTEQGQWANLFDDLRTKTDAVLAGKPSRHPHYMGAIVLESRTVTSSREVPILDVIDGQQRLTTLQILLIAMRDVARDRDIQKMARVVERSILNEHPEEMKEPETEVYKLWPTYHDRDTFLAILNAGSRQAVRTKFIAYFPRAQPRLSKMGKSTQPRLLQGYIFFYDRIAEFLDGTGDVPVDAAEGERRLDALLTTLLQSFRVVEIQLEKDDDAQVIFETLNDRGTPLLASDLIRNFIFLRAAREKAVTERLYEAHWKPFEEPFWSADETRGRLTRKRLEFFLLQYLAARTGREVSLIRLFAEYKDFIQDDGGPQTVQEEIGDILRFAPSYRTLVEGTGAGPLAEVARRLRPWDISTAYPPLLALAVSEIDDSEKAEAFSDIVSYVVRRAVCNLTTKNYNNIFLGLARKLRDAGVSAKAVRDYLLAQQGPSGAWPTDIEFRHSWLESDVYRYVQPSSRLRAILQELEAALRTSKTDPAPMPAGLAIEHFLPQSWISNWPLTDGTKATSDEFFNATMQGTAAESAGGRLGEIARRNRLLHTIGNLTLHTQALGSSIGNGPFPTKQAAFREHGLFQLTKGFTASSIVGWDENSIRGRGEKLFEVARRLWPHPGASTQGSPASAAVSAAEAIV